MIRALIFDFDGLILETEAPDYHAWQQIYQGYGYELPLQIWLRVVGSGFSPDVFDPYLDLQQKLGDEFDRDSIKARQEDIQRTIIEGLSPLPGVVALLDEARQRDLKLAVASSSHLDWVSGHLSRVGLLDRFDVIRTADDVERIKPAPDLFLAALAALDIEADHALVFEDSGNGVTAAQTAGIAVVAVPNELTRHLSLGHADLLLDSLADLSLDDIISRINTNNKR